MPRLILLNKPSGVPSQFSGTPPTLADYIPLTGFYPAGRLDQDSEGLLLTDDGRLQHRITDPRHKTWKTYWVQVEGEPTAEVLARLRAGRDGGIDGWNGRGCELHGSTVIQASRT
jgi:23S rRNA pseudouridine2457 synthase